MSSEFTPQAGSLALITGAAGGIGSAIARRLANAGCRLLLADRSESLLAAVQSELQGAVEATYAYDQGDLASIETLTDQMPTPTIVFNNAGILKTGLLLDMDPHTIEEIIRVNLTGPMLIARQLAPKIIAAGGGVIVNTSSQLAFDGATTRGAYAAAKAGLAQFTRTAASEWAPHGLRVAALAPGRTLTPMNEALLADPKVRADALAGIPSGRFAEADEIARLACFLASPAADYINGETLIADGGFVLTAGRPAP
ncbi:MAG: SDR family NAD(P)-dependent oxidoreductase [Alphaproteobacteria bacterium]